MVLLSAWDLIERREGLGRIVTNIKLAWRFPGLLDLRLLAMSAMLHAQCFWYGYAEEDAACWGPTALQEIVWAQQATDLPHEAFGMFQMLGSVCLTWACFVCALLGASVF